LSVSENYWSLSNKGDGFVSDGHWFIQMTIFINVFLENIIGTFVEAKLLVFL
jgi:hypothetical protein